MKIRKTRNDKRETYIYRFADGTKVELKPGEDGVTKLDIKKLHALDDSEVYYNNKNLRAERTKDEREKIEKWKREYLKNFKSNYGYEPNESELEYAVNERYPRNYNLSLNYAFDTETNEDKSNIAALVSVPFSCENNEWSDRMEKVRALMTDKQKEVIDLMYLKNFTQSEIAFKLGISSAAVKKRIDGAIKIIKNNF